MRKQELESVVADLQQRVEALESATIAPENAPRRTAAKKAAERRG